MIERLLLTVAGLGMAVLFGLCVAFCIAVILWAPYRIHLWLQCRELRRK